MNRISLIDMLLAYANRLKFKNLFLLILGLFVLDLLVPDVVPMIDEIILGLLAVLLANLKKEESQVDQDNQNGNVIEGEVIKEDEKNNQTQH